MEVRGRNAPDYTPREIGSRFFDVNLWGVQGVGTAAPEGSGAVLTEHECAGNREGKEGQEGSRNHTDAPEGRIQIWGLLNNHLLGMQILTEEKICGRIGN
jgi:hypothetical protein